MKYFRFFSSSSPSAIQRNEIGIQTLTKQLHQALFPGQQTRLSKWKLDSIKRHLKKQELWGKQTTVVPEIDFIKLPPLEGNNLYEHFQQMASITHGTYLNHARNLCKSELPIKPTRWNTSTPGWTFYPNNNLSNYSIVAYPDDDALVFDTEWLSSHSQYPIMAVAASSKGWYSWLSPVIFDHDDNNNPNYNHLIPFGNLNRPRVVVGHHISVDRARIKEEYSIEPSKMRFIDTMSLHVAVSGLTSNQRIKWKKIDKELMSEEDEMNQTGVECVRSFDGDDLEWYQVSALNSLADVAKLHLGIKIDKKQRDLFVEGDLDVIRQNLMVLLDYCSTDVDITFRVYQKVFSKFMARKADDNLVCFAGMLEMASAFMPISKRWSEYVETCDQMVNVKQRQVEQNLKQLISECVKATPEQIEGDCFMRQLDWSNATKKNPLPKWYKKLLPSGSTEPQITIKSKITPLLLRMTWMGYPLFYLGKTFGWCYRVPKGDQTSETMKPISKKMMEAKVESLIKESKTGKSPSEAFYLELLTKELESGYFEFFRLPTAAGATDADANCGSPFAKSFISAFEQGKMGSGHPVAKIAIEANNTSSYWISNRKRIKEQFIVWPDQLDYGILIPAIVPMGTVTRRAVERTWLTASNPKANRIGSELKTLVVAPKGYKIVGADVDSQELWIAGLLGDSQLGVHGGTAFGWMTLQGNKAEETDLHSKSAKILGASRDQAKVFNYARIYGSGVRFSANLLCKCDPSITAEDALKRAQALYKHTKGARKYFKGVKCWSGGSESFMFNALENIALSKDPRTPAMGCQIPDSLLADGARRKYITSCVNWVVQSSGVDYLHMLLVSMTYLCQKYSIKARLLITIHDEIRFLVADNDAERATLALQISNLWTRALFSESVGIQNLPLSVAFFSSVDVDHVLRKEVFHECKTPSFPKGISEQGKSYSIYDLKDVSLGNVDGYRHELIKSNLAQRKRVTSRFRNENDYKMFIESQI